MNLLTAKSGRHYHCRASSLASASDEPEEARPSEYKGFAAAQVDSSLCAGGWATWIMSSLISRGESRDLDFHDLRLVQALH